MTQSDAEIHRTQPGETEGTGKGRDEGLLPSSVKERGCLDLRCSHHRFAAGPWANSLTFLSVPQYPLL